MQKIAADYMNAYHPPAHIATVLQRIRDCRTEAMGGHVTVCPECGEEQGIRLGLTSLLHTWGSALVFHTVPRIMRYS